MNLNPLLLNSLNSILEKFVRKTWPKHLNIRSDVENMIFIKLKI
jgi:hypothetical protein